MPWTRPSEHHRQGGGYPKNNQREDLSRHVSACWRSRFEFEGWVWEIKSVQMLKVPPRRKYWIVERPGCTQAGDYYSPHVKYYKTENPVCLKSIISSARGYHNPQTVKLQTEKWVKKLAKWTFLLSEIQCFPPAPVSDLNRLLVLQKNSFGWNGRQICDWASDSTREG